MAVLMVQSKYVRVSLDNVTRLSSSATPPLNCASVWLLTGGYEAEVPDSDVNVYAVLPRSLAHAVGGAGGSLGPDLPDGRRFVAMGAPTRPDDLTGLEDVLLAAYLSVFEAPET